MSDKSIIDFTKMVADLELVGNSTKIEVRHADFRTGQIIVAMSSEEPMSFKDMMARIKFVELTERLVVEKADFETGEITIKVLDHNKNEDLTKEEIDNIIKGHKVMAIKLIRQRTNMSMRDAKKLVDLWDNQLMQRNLK